MKPFKEYVPNFNPFEDEVADQLSIENKICRAEIEEVTSFGKMSVRFNTEMKTEGFNLSMINATLIDIYVIPSGNRASISSFNLS
jgi:hypothetical protein